MSRRRSRVEVSAPLDDSTIYREAMNRQAGKVRSYVVDLIEPWSELHTQHPGTERARMVRIDHPSLLEQLDGSVRTTAGVGSASPASKPPVSLEATSLLGEIAAGVELWAKRFVAPAYLAGVKAGAGSRLRQTSVLLADLARRAPALSETHLDNLTGDVLAWWAHARVVTSWDTAPIKPHVPCTECGVVGKLQVSVEPVGSGDVLRVTSAVCLECRAAWDRDTVDELGGLIEMMLDLARPDVDVVANHIDRASRGTGRAGPWETPTSADALAGVGPDRAWSEPLPAATDTTTAGGVANAPVVT